MAKPIPWLMSLLVCCAVAVSGYAQDVTDVAGNTVTVEFIVHVPADTPVADTVYLCGDHPAFGNWDGRGLELERGYDGTYQGSLTIEHGLVLQYKATRGSWETVEKNAGGGESVNRQVIADADKRVTVMVEGWAVGEADRPEPSLTGDIRKHADFRSGILDNERTLIVYLPPGYEQDESVRYPVLYMHDGQNIFDASTSFAGHEWGVDEAAERLIQTGKIEPIIIVGMYNNSERMTEYTPRPEDDQADAYARFVVEEVKPYIDRTYRTDPAREKTGIVGSSLGGLISLYMVWAHEDTFGLCGGVSPYLGWRDRWLIQQWRASDMAWSAEAKIWIDMGTREGQVRDTGVSDTVVNARTLAGVLGEAGSRPGEGHIYLEVQDGEHNEQAWSQRIDQILLYLYGTAETP